MYYQYPKDYFLQHVFSVKRFDERELGRHYPLLRRYYLLLPVLGRRVRSFVKRRFAPEAPPVPSDTSTSSASV